MTINQRISEYIAAHKKEFTQKGLCEFIKVPQSTMNNWLRMDRSIPAEYVIPISEYLNVSADYLLTGNEYTRLSANNISNSAIVQGNHATTLIVKNGETKERELSEQEIELLRVFSQLDIKKQTTLLSYAFKLEDENKQ